MGRRIRADTVAISTVDASGTLLKLPVVLDLDRLMGLLPGGVRRVVVAADQHYKVNKDALAVFKARDVSALLKRMLTPEEAAGSSSSSGRHGGRGRGGQAASQRGRGGRGGRGASTGGRGGAASSGSSASGPGGGGGRGRGNPTKGQSAGPVATKPGELSSSSRAGERKLFVPGAAD